jgi:UDPglucose 6-dehydrogenase
MIKYSRDDEVTSQTGTYLTAQVTHGVVTGTTLAVIGGGFVGLVTAAGFAEFGHSVTCVEKDPEKLVKLRSGQVPFFERDLDELVRRNCEAGRLSFTDDLGSAIKGVSAVFVTVGTPSGRDGRTDRSALNDVIASLSEELNSDQVIVLKSTVPVGTGKRVAALIGERSNGSKPPEVVNNPEFLREGNAVWDFFNPRRIVIGASNPKSAETINHIYRLGMTRPVPVVVTNNETAEMIKYASNAFLATKVGFINELAGLCDLAEVNVLEVARGMGLDPRIGPEFLDPGPGWGGSCFGKDMKEIIGMANEAGYHWHIGQAVLEANVKQYELIVSKVAETVSGLKGKRVAALGLAFKAGTSDLRDSPAIEVIKRLISGGASVSAFDPQANGEAIRMVPELSLAESIYDAAREADCLVILTEWQEFQLLDFSRLSEVMKRPNIVDGRNLLSPEAVRRNGFNYQGIGQQ